MTCEDAGCPTCCPTGRPLSRDELRTWLDRKPTPEPVVEKGCPFDEQLPPLEQLVCLVHGTVRCAHNQVLDERDWYEFAVRADDTRMVTARECATEGA